MHLFEEIGLRSSKN